MKLALEIINVHLVIFYINTETMAMDMTEI
jgi:hypothetical protein